jgi:hypothetical protein
MWILHVNISCMQSLYVFITTYLKKVRFKVIKSLLLKSITINQHYKWSRFFCRKLQWVSKGFARRIPKQLEFTEDQIEEMRQDPLVRKQ